ncbi:hypothetical protein DFP72DRAFT_856101, partial [Ephemerocybe angulata]
GPCCFCAWLDNVDYTEAKMGLVTHVLANSIGHPEYSGKYAAICARQKCGYYDKPLDTLDPFLFTTDDTEETIKHCGLRQVRILRDSESSTADITTLRGTNKLLQRQDPEYYSILEDNLQRLLVFGLPAKAFWDLFVQCTKCNFVSPRHHYPYFHKCALRVAAPLVTDPDYGPSVAQDLSPVSTPSPARSEKRSVVQSDDRAAGGNSSDLEVDTEGESDSEGNLDHSKGNSSLDTLVDDLLEDKFEAARSSDDPPLTLFS